MTTHVCSSLREQPELRHFSESWLNQEIRNSEIHLLDYLFYRSDRSGSRFGGGVTRIIHGLRLLEIYRSPRNVLPEEHIILQTVKCFRL